MIVKQETKEERDLRYPKYLTKENKMDDGFLKEIN